MVEVYGPVKTMEVGGVEIAYIDYGPSDGTAVLLIHGFPDSARLWRHQIPVLAEAGYQVIAPDLRGFGRSGRPLQVEEYIMPRILNDLTTLLDTVGAEKAHVVGHDWGAAIAWALALRRPERLRTLTALSVGHPSAFAMAGLAQRQKSWYILLFQFEGVAEEWLSQNDWFWLRRWSDSDEVEYWIEDLGRPGALTAGLNFYRANMPPESLLKPPPPYPPLEMPVMGVWSSEDPALTEIQMTASGEFVVGEWSYQRIEGVGHWVPFEAPDQLNALLLDWFATH